MPGIVDAVGLGAFLAIVLAAAVSDLRSRRIPNLLPLGLAVVFVASAVIQARWSMLGYGLGAGAAGLAVGAVGWRLGVWGGGDAKLTAAVALWTGFAGLPRFILVMALAGGLLALVFLALRGRSAASLPYGVAIAIGATDWLLSRILFVSNP